VIETETAKSHEFSSASACFVHLLSITQTTHNKRFHCDNKTVHKECFIVKQHFQHLLNPVTDIIAECFPK